MSQVEPAAARRACAAGFVVFGLCFGSPWLGTGAAAQPVSSAGAGLDAAVEAAAKLPRVHSLLVSWRGQLLLERYFNGVKPTRLANLKSASKSVVSALVGIAIDRSLIAGLDTPIASYFPDLLAGEPDARKRKITVEDLLTMRSGLESTSSRNYGAWVQSANWVRYALRQPLLSDPGTTMQYSTGNTHLLSAILTKVSGTSTWQFARDALARPLGLSLAQWPRDPQGIYFGGNDMLLTPRQMLAFGELYLNGGRANGHQVISARWVSASLESRTRSRRGDRFYGYGWWIRDLAGYRTAYAWGFGGQFIFLVPDLDLVVVMTSTATVGEGRRDHLGAVYDIVEHLVVERIASLTSPVSRAIDSRAIRALP
jgi:CubicO group peptidase (beta-lactamase class C family)